MLVIAIEWFRVYVIAESFVWSPLYIYIYTPLITRELLPIFVTWHQLSLIIKNVSLSVISGLDKLKEAGESVEILSKELVIKEKDLAIASAKTDKVSY